MTEDSLLRVDAREKVTGGALYTSDIRLPGMLYARVLRSPSPAARLVGVDTEAALSIPGVHAIISSENTEPISWYETSSLFPRELKFAGDEVAAVAATSEDVAADALRLISATYERSSHVSDVAAAQKLASEEEKSPQSAGEPTVLGRGDVEAGLRDAAVVIEAEYTTPMALHNSLEAHGTTAAWEGDVLTIWESTQAIFEVRRGVAEALDLPLNSVRVIKHYMGGGFGSKQIAWKHAVIAALLARRTGRPVQLILDREAENVGVGHRNATRQKVRLGATVSGELTAIDAEIVQAVGAYLTTGEAADTSGPYLTLYRCPAVRTRQIPVHTNTGPAVAFRAPGFAEAAFALESAMDELASALELDPIELRRRNYTEENQQKSKPYSSPRGLLTCYERAAARAGWTGRAGDPAPAPHRRRGVGVAAHIWGGGGFAPARAWLKWNADGTVDVITGTQDIGTGSRTALTQVTAEALGISPADVTVHLGDTSLGPYAPTSAGSATLASVGPAVRAAAESARQQLLDIAANHVDAHPGELEIHGGVIRIASEPGRSLSIPEILATIAPDTLSAFGSREPNPDGVSVHSFGVQIAEVEVNTLTGEVTVQRITAAHECGRVVNHQLMASQVIGGVTQGLGYALTEEQVFDHGLGLPLNANLEDYFVPTVADIPEIAVELVDIPDGRANALGVKGVGEPPVIPTAPAVANAIYNAIGIRIRELPISRARILESVGMEDRP